MRHVSHANLYRSVAKLLHDISTGLENSTFLAFYGSLMSTDMASYHIETPGHESMN